MAKGYFLRVGDKTTCGGTILSGSSILSWHGKPGACEGDKVSCGQHVGIYEIVGGVSNFINTGKRQAGTLDSYSTCPCHARFIPSITDFYEQNAKPASPQPSSPPEEPDTYRLRYLCLNASGEPYSNHHYYLVLKDGNYLEGDTDEEGYTEWHEMKKDEEASIHIIEEE